MSQVRMRGRPVALDVSKGLQSEIGPEIESKLPGRGVRTTTPMVLRMGIVLAVAEIAALDAAAQSICASTISARDDSAVYLCRGVYKTCTIICQVPSRWQIPPSLGEDTVRPQD